MKCARTSYHPYFINFEDTCEPLFAIFRGIFCPRTFLEIDPFFRDFGNGHAVPKSHWVAPPGWTPAGQSQYAHLIDPPSSKNSSHSLHFWHFPPVGPLPRRGRRVWPLPHMQITPFCGQFQGHFVKFNPLFYVKTRTKWYFEIPLFIRL